VFEGNTTEQEKKGERKFVVRQRKRVPKKKKNENEQKNAVWGHQEWKEEGRVGKRIRGGT